jgi:hypothetical protein
MDRITYASGADGRTILQFTVTRPVDSGYVRYVLQSAVEFLGSAEHQSVAGITITAPIANAHSAGQLERAAQDARGHGVDGQVIVHGGRCELRLSRVGADPSSPNGPHDTSKLGQTDQD